MTDYATIADIERALNIDITLDLDPTIGQFITRASGKIDDFCKRDFTEHTAFVEYYDGRGKWGELDWQRHNRLVLNNRPVLAVTELEVNGVVWTEGTEYEVYLEDSLILLTPDTRYFIEKIKGIKVTYDYGYTAVPEAIKDVCTWLVVQALKKLEKFGELGVAASLTVEGHSVSIPEFKDVPDDLKEVLQYHVKWLW